MTSSEIRQRFKDMPKDAMRRILEGAEANLEANDKRIRVILAEQQDRKRKIRILKSLLKSE